MFIFPQNLLVIYCLLLLPLASLSNQDERQDRPFITLTMWRNFTGTGELHLFGSKLNVQLMSIFENENDVVLKYNLMVILDDNHPVLVGETNITFVDGLLKTAKFELTLNGFADNIRLDGTLNSKMAPAGVSELNSETLYSTEATLKLPILEVNYQCQFSWPNECGGWPQLHHTFNTNPSGILNFSSTIEPICPGGEMMNILIDVDSAAWPLAVFHLNQKFVFKPDFGQESMHAYHAFFKALVEGTWNNNHFFKTAQVDLTKLASQIWPQIPNHWEINFFKNIQNDVLNYLVASVKLSQNEYSNSDWQQIIMYTMNNMSHILFTNVILPSFEWLGIILGWWTKHSEYFVKSGLIWPTLVGLVFVAFQWGRYSNSY